jgi:hypothetical protein
LEQAVTLSYNTAKTIYPHITMMTSDYNSLPQNMRGENIELQNISAKTDIKTLRKIQADVLKKVTDVLTTNMYKLNMYDLGGGGKGGKGLHRMHGGGLLVQRNGSYYAYTKVCTFWALLY